MSKVWEEVVGVKITGNWRDGLSEKEFALIEPIADRHQEDFHHLTLRQIKLAIGKPLSVVFEILAKIEATYWDEAHYRAAIDRFGRAAGPSLPVKTPPAPSIMQPMTEQMRALFHECLALPWVKAIEKYDLRFKFSYEELAAEFQSARAAGHASADLVRLADAIMQADRNTYTQELRELVRAALLAHKRPTSKEMITRWTDIFVLRYATDNGLVLAQVGEAVGVTRERVRQICDLILNWLRHRPSVKPALMRAFKCAGRIAPCPVSEIDEQIAPYLGQGCGIRAALAFDKDASLDLAHLQVVQHKVRVPDGYQSIDVLASGSDEQPEWIKVTLQTIRRECSSLGCTSVVRMAGLMAIEQGVLLDRESILSLAEQIPGFRRLDSDGMWFTVGVSSDSAAASRVKKMLAVSDGNLPISDIAAALVADGAWLPRESETGVCIPPIQILNRLVGGWPWLHVNQHNKFTAADPGLVRKALSATDLATIEVFDRHAGIVNRKDIADALMRPGAHGPAMTSMGVSAILANSVIIQKLEFDLYALRGRCVNPNAIKDARLRAQVRGMSYLDVDLSKPVAVKFTRPTSTVKVSRQVVYLPVELKHKISGTFVNAKYASQTVRVSGSQILRGVQVADMAGIGQGETYEIVFDMQQRSFEVRRPQPA